MITLFGNKYISYEALKEGLSYHNVKWGDGRLYLMANRKRVRVNFADMENGKAFCLLLLHKIGKEIWL